MGPIGLRSRRREQRAMPPLKPTPSRRGRRAGPLRFQITRHPTWPCASKTWSKTPRPGL